MREVNVGGHLPEVSLAGDVHSAETFLAHPTMALVGRFMAIVYPKITQNTPQGFPTGYPLHTPKARDAE